MILTVKIPISRFMFHEVKKDHLDPPLLNKAISSAKLQIKLKVTSKVSLNRLLPWFRVIIQDLLFNCLIVVFGNIVGRWVDCK